MKIKTIVPYFGNARMISEEVGRRLGKLNWCGIPFAGGMPEVRCIDARTIVANDVHRHVINLAKVIASPYLNSELRIVLGNLLFHPDTLKTAQNLCVAVEKCGNPPDIDGFDVTEEIKSVSWAAAYFIVCWMSRSSIAGTKREFDGNLCLRWEAGGGDSRVRWQSAIDGLKQWGDLLREKCTFSTLDCLEFLAKCKDRKGHGIYADFPFPGPGAKYKHTITLDKLSRIALVLKQFHQARVIVRCYDVPFVRENYPESDWLWHPVDGRKQTNEKTVEYLLESRR